MAMYRDQLPQLSGGLFLGDGGIETSLIFLDGLDLPLFAAFTLLKDKEGKGWDALVKYFRSYVELAREHELGIILESATWRASPDYAAQLGYSKEALAEATRESIELLQALRPPRPQPHTPPIVISGCIGPRGDGYDPKTTMSEVEAEAYHAEQVRIFAQETSADLVTCVTMTHSAEAVGIVRACVREGVGCVVSFTVETDGRLPTGQGLGEAVTQVDSATDCAPVYYMVNCAHPTHFAHALDEGVRGGGGWVQRMRGVRVNASCKSHKELDEATELDAGDPEELARLCADLRSKMPQLCVLGGCCGTDTRHIAAIAKACKNL